MRTEIGEIMKSIHKLYEEGSIIHQTPFHPKGEKVVVERQPQVFDIFGEPDYEIPQSPISTDEKDFLIGSLERMFGNRQNRLPVSAIDIWIVQVILGI